MRRAAAATPPFGTDATFVLRHDDGGAPGPAIGPLEVGLYDEVPTGEVIFNRPVVLSTVLFEPLEPVEVVCQGRALAARIGHEVVPRSPGASQSRHDRGIHRRGED